MVNRRNYLVKVKLKEAIFIFFPQSFCLYVSIVVIISSVSAGNYYELILEYYYLVPVFAIQLFKNLPAFVAVKIYDENVHV